MLTIILPKLDSPITSYAFQEEGRLLILSAGVQDVGGLFGSWLWRDLKISFL